jgi:hypothetical protein
MVLQEMGFDTGKVLAAARSEVISTVTVRNFDGLAPHLAAWDRLAWQAPQKIANLLPAWIDAFLRHRLGPQDHWLCIFAYAGDALVGAMPVVVTPHPVLGAKRPMLQAPFDSLTPSGDIVLAPEYAHAAFRALLEQLAREVPGHVGIDLKAVRSTSTLWKALEGNVDGYFVRRGLRNFFAFLDVTGNFQSHHATLGKTRSHLKRFRRKLESRGTVSVTLDKSAAFLSEFVALEASGWKGRNHTSIADNPKVMDFYTTLVRNFVAQGRWEWLALRVDGRVVAAQMGVRCGSSLAVPKTAFDEDYAEGRPGTLSSEELLKSAFARPDIDEVNPMSDGPLHRLWHMNRDAYVDVHLVRRNVVGAMFQLPRVSLAAAYQTHVRPRIPDGVKKAYEQFRRRGDRKPRRAGAAEQAGGESTE